MIRDIHAVNPHIHTIVMTAYGQNSVSDSTATAPARVDRYLRNSVELTALTAAIDGCIGTR